MSGGEEPGRLEVLHPAPALAGFLHSRGSEDDLRELARRLVPVNVEAGTALDTLEPALRFVVSGRLELRRQRRLLPGDVQNLEAGSVCGLQHVARWIDPSRSERGLSAVAAEPSKRRCRDLEHGRNGCRRQRPAPPTAHRAPHLEPGWIEPVLRGSGRPRAHLARRGRGVGDSVRAGVRACPAALGHLQQGREVVGGHGAGRAGAAAPSGLRHAGRPCGRAPGTQEAHAAGVCTGNCIYTQQHPETVCDDKDACTGSDKCGLDAACRGTPTVQCNNPPSQCHERVGSCTAATGTCVYAFKGPTTACDDSNACTTSDTCNGAGSCAGEPLPPCTPSTACHKSERLGCPSNVACTESVDATKVNTPCTVAARSGVCRSPDGACSSFPYVPSNFDPDSIPATGASTDLRSSCGAPANPVIRAEPGAVPAGAAGGSAGPARGSHR